jgi:hypothetical protein
VTRAGRPALSLIPGGLSLVPLASPAPTVDAPRSPARSAARIVAAAQQWAALMIETGRADRLALDGPELEQVTLALLDSVDEYEAHAAGMTSREHEQGPAATLW